MLDIQNLQVQIGDQKILNGINLTIKPGEIHAIMGPNGSGKSTLANVLAGRAGYTVTAGHVFFYGQDLLAMPPEERAVCGLFLSFQYPQEIAGVNTLLFLKTALNNLRKKQQLHELDSFDLLNLIKQQCKIVEIDDAFLKRPLNLGFSGGEKKRNEILQLLTLNPKLAILDEPDSGLDIDALQIVARGINTFYTPEKSLLLVTHYQRLLNYVVPDYVHILAHGQIVRSGDKTLAQELEQKGYGWIDGSNDNSDT